MSTWQVRTDLGNAVYDSANYDGPGNVDRIDVTAYVDGNPVDDDAVLTYTSAPVIWVTMNALDIATASDGALDLVVDGGAGSETLRIIASEGLLDANQVTFSDWEPDPIDTTIPKVIFWVQGGEHVIFGSTEDDAFAILTAGSTNVSGAVVSTR